MKLSNKVKDKRKTANMVFIVLLLIHLIVISFNRSPWRPDLSILQVILLTVTTPFQPGLGNSIVWFSDGWKSYVELRGVREENLRLKVERTEMETRLVGLREQLKVYERESVLNDWLSQHTYASIKARVIGRDANHLFNTVVIDKGAMHGVKKDQPVVDGSGLVGRVIVVAPFSSRVMLVTDERHGAGTVIGLTAETRMLGVLKGVKDNFYCQMDFITPSVKVENGEQVLTSGQDGLYPQGLLIGWVANPAGFDSTQQRIVVQPAATLARLDLVAVLQVTREQIRGGIDAVVDEEQRQEAGSARKKK